MCGIFCSLSHHGHIEPDDQTTALLRNRGPDHLEVYQTVIVPDGSVASVQSQVHATFLSTVLALRGSSVVKQPLVDPATASLLCWNGEAWSINGEPVVGNDSQIVLSRLLEASARDGKHAERAVIDLLCSIRGPYALVFLDARNNRVFYGRDCLGRRSLLRKDTNDGSLVLSSVRDNASGNSWSEVEADGIYILNFTEMHHTKSMPSPKLVRHRRLEQEPGHEISYLLPFPAMDQTLPTISRPCLDDIIQALHASLQDSLRLRVQHVREAVQQLDPPLLQVTKVAVLFSGGLDCTILARMCHDLLPLQEPIDLLNVAFENPRVHGKLGPSENPYELCPDRITGRSSYSELIQVCPGRAWRFVQVNVPYSESQAHRGSIMTLMHPHNTEMDLSISSALYFASRGKGSTNISPEEKTLYTTSAHVLLSGLGADELFGGYQRHATAFARHSYRGLLNELELDFDRLGKRNLGRDDRVISNSGKEVRFPFLDEDFIALTLRLPVTVKCDFGSPQVEGSPDPALRLEPAKRALRLLAWDLGMKQVAAEKKRAIQFGARTAKMETGRTKGTHVLT
ncbi:hypothetical protein ACN47E_009594 [Coniothyrium glycines]